MTQTSFDLMRVFVALLFVTDGILAVELAWWAWKSGRLEEG